MKDDRQSFLSVAGIVLSAVVLIASAFWILRQIQSESSDRLRDSLQTVVGTTKEALRIWGEDTKNEVLAAAQIPEVRSAVLAQLRGSEHSRRQSKALLLLRQSLGSVVQQEQYVDFVVIDRDGTQIAAGLDVDIGGDLIARRNAGMIHSVFAGEPALSTPFRSTQPRPDTIKMLAAAPILDDSASVVAALGFIVNPAEDITNVTRLGRMGKSGETYAFDKQGRMVSASRFADFLRNRGLAEVSEAGVSIVEIRDPGGDITHGFRPLLPRDRQPLTRMAASATRGENGVDITGYRDYRGVPVVGAWSWDSTLEIGLATEIDLAEAKRPIIAVRNLTLLLLVVIAAVVGAIVFLLQNRFRMSKRVFGYEKAAEARRNIIAMVSHDLRNPINAICLSSSVLKNMLAGPTDVQVMSRTLDIIQRAGIRMNRMVNDLLDTTNIEVGHLIVERVECDVEMIIEEAVQMISPMAREKSVDLVYSAGTGLPKINADPQRLVQILSNLLGNAIKFTPAHGGVTLRTSIIQGDVQFAVSDTGPGIPDYELPRIFEQYWQGTTKKGGAGLGLFITKGLVEAHNGRIWIQNTSAKGTTICFTIPAAAGTAKERTLEARMTMSR